MSRASEASDPKRDLYVRLLELGAEERIEGLLEAALALVVDVTGADRGYIELTAGNGAGPEPRWSLARELTAAEIEVVRTNISRGIVAESLARGQTIMTPSALLDPRFRERASVRAGKIEAVLCAPIGDGEPLGVLYLQRHLAGPFSPEACRNAEMFALRFAPLADRLVARELREPDATRPYRATLALEHVAGRSVALAALLREVTWVVPRDVTVLLTGESGTGKSQIARVIHDNGPRAERRFVELNCGAIPETLLENELFGAAPGAHSTAERFTEGKVAAAEGGTLFFDEISDLSLPAQAKLLHLLQSRQYYPLGSVKPINADVRVLAATNIDLDVAVAEGRFRSDLFYRLQVMPIRVPSLAERTEDIPELARHCGQMACDRHRLPCLTLSRGAIAALVSAAWPGNVRQLAHTVEAAAIRAAGEGVVQIEASHLFPSLRAAAVVDETGITFQAATQRFQAQLLSDALAQENWNVVEVARRLDLARSHVYRLIQTFGLRRDPE